jgi:hypothetical protein
MNSRRLDTSTRSASCDDARLVAASLDGDREAFAQIVTRYQALVALHANDAVADAYIRNGVFFRFSYVLLTTWLWPTMLLATLPSLLIWRATRKSRWHRS